MSIPDVRARLLDELTSTIDLFAAALARRAGRREDDFVVRTTAGAVLGIALAAWLDAADDLETCFSTPGWTIWSPACRYSGAPAGRGRGGWPLEQGRRSEKHTVFPAPGSPISPTPAPSGTSWSRRASPRGVRTRA
ncbi:MAG TPA: hypothetical protein VLW50_14135 [Streptosporangiaceae bacterium]|nr:hypothetical protein [Streptosporangiaceae bacterium]